MVQWAVVTQISCSTEKPFENSINFMLKTGIGVNSVSLLTALGRVIKTKALAPRA